MLSQIALIIFPQVNFDLWCTRKKKSHLVNPFLFKIVNFQICLINSDLSAFSVISHLLVNENMSMYFSQEILGLEQTFHFTFLFLKLIIGIDTASD